MKTIRWNLEKAKLVKETRNLDFSRAATMIKNEEFLATLNIPSRVGQKMYVLNYDGDIIGVPYVETEQEIFLKTAYKSRKLTKLVRGWQ